MKKENFICPCCGLPNHLEFKSKDDYDSYLEGQHSSDKFEANPNNYQFNRYILEENEEESDGRKKEIEDRFNLIKDYWDKYQNFNEWFSNEVVGFIPEETPPVPIETNYYLKNHLDLKDGEEHINLLNYKITKEKHIDLSIYKIINELHTEIISKANLGVDNINYTQGTSDYLVEEQDDNYYTEDRKRRSGIEHPIRKNNYVKLSTLIKLNDIEISHIEEDEQGGEINNG